MAEWPTLPPKETQKARRAFRGVGNSCANLTPRTETGSERDPLISQAVLQRYAMRRPVERAGQFPLLLLVAPLRGHVRDDVVGFAARAYWRRTRDLTADDLYMFLSNLFLPRDDLDRLRPETERIEQRCVSHFLVSRRTAPYRVSTSTLPPNSIRRSEHPQLVVSRPIAGPIYRAILNRRTWTAPSIGAAVASNARYRNLHGRSGFRLG